MRNLRLLAPVALAVLVLAGPGLTQTPLRQNKPLFSTPPPPSLPAPTPSEATVPGLPALRIGALLPLTGASAWYGEEMRRGMELAVADLNPARQPSPPATTPPAPAGPAEKPDPSKTRESENAPGSPAVRVVLDVVDVRALDVKAVADEFNRVATAGAAVVFTASPTPTLAVHPLAAARDILVVHQGLPSVRFPATSRTLLGTRPGAGARGEATAAYAWERGIRRLAVLAAGDEFGKAVRAALGVRWRERGGSLAYDESLTLEAPDLPARLTRLTRLAPEAVCLAFRGQDLGELARRVREAGYPGLLLALDDDPAVLLAAGPALTDTLLLSDAFVPEPDSRGAKFAKTYTAKFKRPPSRFAASAYDAVAVLAEGARLALQGGRGRPGGARLREALTTRRTFPSLYGAEVVVRDDGTFERAFALFAVESGRSVFVRYVTPAGRPALEGRLAPTSRRLAPAG